MEHDHRNSGFFHWTWQIFHTSVNVYQRVSIIIPEFSIEHSEFPEFSRSFPMVSTCFRHSQRLSPFFSTAIARTARWISWSASVPAVCCAAATRKPSCGTWWRPRRGAPDGRTGLDLIWANHGKTIGRWWLNGISWDLPSGYVKIALENDNL